MSETSPLLVGVGATLAGLAVVVALLAVAFQPLLVVPAGALGLAGGLIWLHGTGRLWTRTPGRFYRLRARARARRRAGAGRGGGERGAGGSSAAGEGGSRAAGVGRGASRDARQRWRERSQGRRGRHTRRGAFRDGGPRDRTTGRTAGGPGVDAEGPSLEEARQVLDVDPGSDPDQVRRAYRRRVKQAHPDAADGSEEEFKRVQTAYETLRDRS